MRRTITHVFRNIAVLTDLTEQLSQIDNQFLSFANTERIVLTEGIVHIKYFSNFLFFLELTNFELHTDLDTGFINEKTRLFLFMMLKGNITFFTKEGSPIRSAENNTVSTPFFRQLRLDFSNLRY